jgi:hypothetical protein
MAFYGLPRSIKAFVSLQALFRSTEHISSNEVNLTKVETVYLSKLAEDVNELLRKVQELENSHCQSEERSQFCLVLN